MCGLRKCIGDGKIKETMTKKIISHCDGIMGLFTFIWYACVWVYRRNFLGFLFFIFRIAYSSGFALDFKWHKYYLITCLHFSGPPLSRPLCAHCTHTRTTHSILLPHDDNSWLNWSILLPISTIHYFTILIFMFSYTQPTRNDSMLHLISMKKRRITAKEDLHNIYARTVHTKLNWRRGTDIAQERDRQKKTRRKGKEKGVWKGAKKVEMESGRGSGRGRQAKRERKGKRNGEEEGDREFVWYGRKLNGLRKEILSSSLLLLALL